MYKVLVYLVALILPATMFAETFKVTLHRPSQVGTAMLQPGEYRVEISGSKAEFRKGKEMVTAEVKQEPLPSKANKGYVRYASDPQDRVLEIVTRGSSVRWLFP